jgi:hypothetical protein
MVQINIQDEVCWRCGHPFVEDVEGLERTVHHTLPRQLNPTNNITVPIHKKCHEEITSQDVSSLSSHAYKILRQVEKMNSEIGGLNNMIGKMTFIKVTANDKSKINKGDK